MTRVTVLAAAAAAVILLGISILGTPEPRSQNHAAVTGDTVAPKSPLER